MCMEKSFFSKIYPDNLKKKKRLNLLFDRIKCWIFYIEYFYLLAME